MAVVGEATVIVKGDASKFGAETERQIAGGLDPVAKRIASVLGGAFVGAKVFGELKQGLDELKDAAAVSAQTDAAIKSTGSAAHVTSDEISGLAGSLSELSGSDDELIQKGANLLLTFKNVRNEVGDNNDIFNQATEAALDLSTAGFGSMESASVLLGKALNDPVKGVTALQRVGVALSDQQKDLVKQLVATGDTLGAQKIILQEVESQVGGSAKAFGETLPGQLAKAQTASDNMKGALVGGLAPALELGASALTSVVEHIEGLPGPAQTAIGGVLGLTAAFFTIARPVNEGIKLLETLGVIHRAVATAEVASAAEQVAAEEAVTAAVVEREAVVDVAAIRRITSNQAIVFSEAEVTAAVAAREAAAAQALFGQGALIAADEAFVAAETEAAAAIAAHAAALEAEAAAGAATATSGAGALAAIGGIGIVAAPAAAVLGILGKSWLDQRGANAAAEQTVRDYTEALKSATGAVQEHVDAVTAQKLVDAGVTGLLEKAGISARSFADEVRNGGDAAVQFANGMHQLEPTTAATVGFIERMTHATDPFSKSLIEAYKAGQLTWPEVRKLADQARSLSNEFGTATDRSKENAAAEGVVKEITGETTQTIEEQEAALASASKAADAFGGFISDIASAMEKSYKASVSQLEVTSDYEGAVDDLVGTLRKGSDVLYENAQTLDLNSKKGRENTAALLDTGEAIAALIEKRFQETHSTQDAIDIGKIYVQNLHDQLIQAGFTEDQVASYIDTMNLTPEDIATTFSNNAVEQQLVIGKYLKLLDDIDPVKRTEIETLIDQGQYAYANALINNLTSDRSITITFSYGAAMQGLNDALRGAGVTSPSGNARGTDWWPGGMSWVGEQGKELVYLPRGSAVVPNSDLTEALGAASIGGRRQATATLGGDHVEIRVDARGARDPWAVGHAVGTEYTERKWRFPRR